MKKAAAVLVALALSAAAVAQTAPPPPEPATKPAAKPVVATAVPKPGTNSVAVLDTDLGKIVVEFFPEKAPRHVKNFLNLCKSGFYNGTKFHRTVPGFMVQGGDPNTRKGDPATWGTGGNVGPDGAEITVPAEFNDTPHLRGVLSMARAADPNSASSQFFICVADARFLDGKYTAFGRVLEGMDVVDKIVNAPAGPRGPNDPEGSRPVKPVVLRKATVEKRPVQATAPAGGTPEPAVPAGK